MNSLTFGVELEFCLATLPEGAEDPKPFDSRQVYGISDANAVNHFTKNQLLQPANLCYLKQRLQNDIVQRHLAETLISAGFPAITDADVRRQAAEAGQGAAELPQYKSWHVTIDPSIRVPGEDNVPGLAGYEWYKMELVSPVLDYSPQALRRVKKLCKLIHRRYRTLTNEWCGLHVHVGLGSKGLPDYTIRSLAALIWTFEDRLDLLHPLHRVNDEACTSLYNTAPLAGQLDLETDKPLRIREQLETILACGAGDQVVHLLNDECPNYGHAYNLWNLRSQLHRSAKRTIEFRQHEGTLDTQRVGNWIEVCVGLVNFAHQVPPDHMGAFLKSAVDNEEYTIDNLLLSIGLPRQAEYYGNAVGRLA